MKKGFTVVEILVVIALLGVLSVITVPNIIKSFNENKERIYNEKLNIVQSAAKKYASEHLNSALRITNETNANNTCVSSYQVNINTLISNNYIKSEDVTDLGNISYCMYYLINEQSTTLNTSTIINTNGKVIVKKVG